MLPAACDGVAGAGGLDLGELAAVQRGAGYHRGSLGLMFERVGRLIVMSGVSCQVRSFCRTVMRLVWER